MKQVIAVLLAFSFYGCTRNPPLDNSSLAKPSFATEKSVAIPQCVGNTQLPVEFAGKFEAVEDEALLKLALGEPAKGRLCQGKVYVSQDGSDITIYRAWNSTNPNSEFGHWWAFTQPSGKVSRYRADYEICYQWSPLDKLSRCRLKPGVKIVVGTGQSAECSLYLTYPISAETQIYLDDASALVADCTTYDNEFSWK